MFFKKYTPKEAVKSLVINAVIASAYVVLTVLNFNFSYGAIQFRISEMLVLICFFRPDTIIGLTIGCLLANANAAANPMFMYDMLFGTLGTFISCLFMIYMPRLLLAAIMPIVVNAFVVGAELYFVLQQPFWFSVAMVGLGQLVVIAVGYVVFLFLMRNKKFMDIIGATRHREVKW